MGRRSAVPRCPPMIATASGAMLAGVAETEPDRFWFGKGGCVERHDAGGAGLAVRAAVRPQLDDALAADVERHHLRSFSRERPCEFESSD